MNTKTKSGLVLIGVLLIGIIIGAMGSTMVRRQMWEDRISRFKSPEGFLDRFVKTIQPKPDQIEAIKKILIKHHEKMKTISEESRNMIKNHADSLIIELKPVLTDEQLERTKKVIRRRRPGGRHPQEKPEPPPDVE